MTELFHEWLERRKSRTTVENYLYWLRRFLQEETSVNNAEEFREALNRFYERHPCYPVMGFIKNICKWRDVKAPELDKSLIPKNKKIPETYSRSEVNELIEGMHPHYQDALRIMIETGLRVHEVLGLRQRDVRYSEGRIRVSGKGGKERIVYPSDELLRRLKARQAEHTSPSGWLFPSPMNEDEPIVPETLRYHLRRIMKGAKPHTFRHTFATRMLMQGVNLRTIQKSLGHSNVSTTAIYTHVFDEDVQEAMKKVQE